MDCQYIVGGLATLVALVLLKILILGKNMKSTPNQTQTDNTVKSYRDSKSMSADDNTGSTDVIIVGAGVAGSALAYALGKDGWRVQVIEKDLSEPDRIAGEFLLPAGYLKLIELGLEDCVDGIDAFKTFGLTLHQNGKRLKLPIPLADFHADHAPAHGFHNGRFVVKMREKAASLPNVNVQQGTVISLMEEKGTIKGVTYKTKSGQELIASAPLTIVCDGCFSSLRRFLCDPKIEIPSSFVGLILRNCDLPQGHDHVHLIFADTPIIVYRISSTELRCLVDVLGQKVPSISNGEMATYLKTVIAPQIPQELYNAFVSAIDEGNMKAMFCRRMPTSPYPTPGAFLIGDAFNMRNPMTGGGMTVALSDVVILRDLLRPLRDLTDSAALCKQLEPFHALRKPMASTLNMVADALHMIFSSSSDPVIKKEMREACMAYLGIGGALSSRFTALICGLDHRPLSLLVQFSAILVYGIGCLLLPFPSPKRLWVAARLLLGASGVIFPIMKTEGVRNMF
ncbi:Squalene epoxidase 1 [Turnera subulata]|uniref:Squalene monooxygenase n=1 Tax=Turnera subulata TaxID=218843 RepID=A0A9Q0FM98_9ROSI|nr:Squalene epoxidase 1 [Turnera subulata]